MADSYFDALNTMMITGSMNRRAVLRKKIESRPAVISARIIRAKAVDSLFGKGKPDEHPKDAFDERALSGEEIVHISRNGNERALTVINPILASKNYRGTNCLNCHTNASEGEVLGAVRITYSLSNLDRQVERNLVTAGVIQSVVFGLGLLLISHILRRVIVAPVDRLRQTMDDIENTANLTRRVDTPERIDEIGRVGHAFDRMLNKFQTSLSEILINTRKQHELAQELASIADEAEADILEQNKETSLVTEAIRQLNIAIHEVAKNAAQTAEATQNAQSEAQNGAHISTNALGGIEVLVREVAQVEAAITNLNDEIEGIGEALDVIKEIAGQTNLLALNAAIEAARAGDKGRGFSVVADEVRTLAIRSQHSADRIHDMILKLKERAGDAVRAMQTTKSRAHTVTAQVGEAAESLAVIASEITSINERNAQIATAAEEQSSVVAEIHRNVENINTIAEKSTASAELLTENSNEIRNLTLHIHKLIAKFRLS